MEEELSHDRLCIFCNSALDNGQATSVLGKKGCETINIYSSERNSSISVKPGQSVHRECRCVYCHPQTANSKVNSSPISTEHTYLRSSVTSFNFRRDCFYCGESITDYDKKRKLVSCVMTKGAQDTILADCASRDDHWAECVRARITNVHDLPAADAMYHKACSTRFRTQKTIPDDKPQAGRPSTKHFRTGRPVDEEQEEAFLKVAQYFRENDDETQTLGELTMKMTEYLGGDCCKAYSLKHMKNRMKEHFGDDIIITTINGKTNVVTLRSAERILLDFHRTLLVTRCTQSPHAYTSSR